jgi:4-amino-4-deoxy-L-arabinose transferase-like glycosyltransferase
VARTLRALGDPVLAALLLLGAFLLFGNLGGRGLWQDEAETAMLARRALVHGVPLADDGVNAVSSELGRDRGADGVWNWSPWLPIYVEAASFRLLGEGDAAARLPFALAGFLCLPAVYLLSRRWFESAAAARLSTLALALSTAFVLHARQARWYALAALGAAALALALDAVLARRRGAVAAFSAAGLALFYANDFVAIGLVAALWAAAPLLRPARDGWRRLALATALVAAGALPGALYFRVLDKPGAFDAARVLSQGASALVLLCAHLLPWPALALLARAAARRLRPEIERRRVSFLLAWCLAYAAYLALAPWLFFRYLIVLAPAAAVLVGQALDVLRRRSRAAALLGALLLATDLFARAPWSVFGVRSAGWTYVGPTHAPWVRLAEEIVRGYPSCDRAAAAYLKERAAPSDVVLTNYGDGALQFYSGLRVRGGEQGPPWPEAPDWVVVHPYEISRDPGRDWTVLQFIRARVAPGGAGYEVQPFVCRDPVLADAPEPDTHRFSPPSGGSSLVILRRFASTGPGSE